MCIRDSLFTPEGRMVGSAQREFQQIFPAPGWVEHDPEEIWRTQRTVAEETLTANGLDAADIAAVGITNQRETTVVWDRATGEPISNAIVWQDRRTASECDRLRTEGHAEQIQHKTGLLLDAYFSATKIAWLLDNIDGARARAKRGELAFGTIDSWLVYKLTGGQSHVTDASNASRTLLFDIHRGAFDSELAELFRVPLNMAPQVCASSGTDFEISTIPALKGVPITGIVGDQQAALAGQVCFAPGESKNTYGTGCFALLNTGARACASKNHLLTTIAWQRGNELTYALEGSVFVGGAVVQWLRDGLGIIDRASDVEALARSVDDTADVHLVPAFAGLGAPHWDPYARGTLVGLTRGSSKAHIARAALEGIAFQVADLLEALEADAGDRLGELRVDGGAAANDLLMQLQADLWQKTVLRPEVIETTALGAAHMAGLGAGLWKDPAELRHAQRTERAFEPSISPEEAAERRERWQQAVERSRGWAPSS